MNDRVDSIPPLGGEHRKRRRGEERLGDRKRLVGIRDQGGEPWDRKRHALSCRVARVLSDFITRTNY